jgi:phosphoenolpyruvate-protein kinase (PTS system EI component)
VRILFPLIATLGELREALAVLEDCRIALRREGYAPCSHNRVGVMIEVPAAAMMVDRLSPEVDFFSIGTNDLVQYMMAADRSNAGVAGLVSGFQPAVLRLVRDVIRSAHKYDRPVGLCGELAGEPAAIPILLGLGLDEFSMSPPSVPLAKQIVRELTLSDAQALAEAALEMDSPQAVQDFIRREVPVVDVAVA